MPDRWMIRIPWRTAQRAGSKLNTSASVYDECEFYGSPSPSGKGTPARQTQVWHAGYRPVQILRPSTFLEASPYRARASRPLPEGEGINLCRRHSLTGRKSRDKSSGRLPPKLKL